MKKFFKFIFSRENEYTKKWIARFTSIVLFLLVFYPFLSQELLLFHFKNGLSYRMCSLIFTQYTSFAIVLITGFAVTWLGAMGKSFFAKQQEEANRTKLKLASLGVDDDSTDDEEEEENYE